MCAALQCGKAVACAENFGCRWLPGFSNVTKLTKLTPFIFRFANEFVIEFRAVSQL